MFIVKSRGSTNHLIFADFRSDYNKRPLEDGVIKMARRDFGVAKYGSLLACFAAFTLHCSAQINLFLSTEQTKQIIGEY